MAKSATQTKEITVDKKDFAKADKKQLRIWCDAHGIEWSKTEDNEASLRQKLNDFFDEAALVEVENKSDESEEEDVMSGDPKHRAGTDGATKAPMDCYGWHHDPQSKFCGECPNKVGCKSLTATAPALADALEAELEASLDEEADEAETEAIKESLQRSVAKVKAKPKKEEEVPKLKVKVTKNEVEPEDEENYEAEEEEEAPTIIKRRTPVTEKDNFQVLYDRAHVASMPGAADAEDEDEKEHNEDVKKFYKALILTSEKKYEGGPIPGKVIKKGLTQIFGLEAEDLEEGFREVVGGMVSDGSLKVVK